jgi:uncharacterized protein (TIGR02145 family)
MKNPILAILPMLLLSLLITPTPAPAAQERPNAAVYVAGTPANRNILRAAVNNSLVNSGIYNVIAVDAIDIVAKEHIRHHSGAVRDSEIAVLGEDAGAQYVCVVERIDDGKTFYYISVKMVSVGRKIAELSKMSERISEGNEITETIQALITAMLNLPPPAPHIVNPKDGKKYRIVQVGGQVWMAENMNHKTGTSWCYDNKDANCQKYGRLYDWNTAKTVCPQGWRLPMRREWDFLIETAGGEESAGKKLKSKEWNGTDEYDWTAVPGGSRQTGTNSFNSEGDFAAWWTATESGSGKAFGRYMVSGRENVYENESEKETGKNG